MWRPTLPTRPAKDRLTMMRYTTRTRRWVPHNPRSTYLSIYPSTYLSRPAKGCTAREVPSTMSSWHCGKSRLVGVRVRVRVR